MALLSMRSTGIPITFTRKEATIQLPMIHGPTLAGGGGLTQPAIA
ncbi:MAG: hypothetical protein QNJ64_07795 [Crocosphaera sp.]|nr:hypothetical protein [Crocosphaera sp.]